MDQQPNKITQEFAEVNAELRILLVYVPNFFRNGTTRNNVRYEQMGNLILCSYEQCSDIFWIQDYEDPQTICKKLKSMLKKTKNILIHERCLLLRSLTKAAT